MSKEQPKEVIIIENRFFAYGEAAPTESRFQGTITEESLIGYSNYTDSEKRESAQKEIGMRNDGYIGYTNKHGEGTTMSYLGYLDNKNRKKMEKEIISSFNHHGCVAWEFIVSLPSFEYAKKAGLETVNDYNALLQKIMPKVFKKMNLEPKNIIWWADYHDDTDHPHNHIVWLEKRPTRTKGKLSKKELDSAKVLFTNELLAKQRLQEKIKMSLPEFMKEKDQDFYEIIDTFSHSDFVKHPKIKVLRTVLPKTGRLQYKAKNMLRYKPLIDTIITDCLNNKEIKPLFDEYMEKVELLEKNMNQSANSKISNIKNAELKKLYSQIGNNILDSYKNKVKTPHYINNQQIREYYQEKHLRQQVKSLLSSQIWEKERELDEWARNNGIDIHY